MALYDGNAMDAANALAIDPDLTLICARARNGVIGRGNEIPWRLPEDLKHFKATTLGHVLIMGRRTFDSIGRPLPGRATVVVSRQADWRAEGCVTAASLAAALAIAHAEQRGEIFAAGGADIYRQSLPIAARLLLTEIDIEVDGDTHFPAFDAAQWQLHSREEHRAANGMAYAIADWRRRR